MPDAINILTPGAKLAKLRERVRARLAEKRRKVQAPAPKKFSESGSPRLATVKNVEIFAAGTHRDKEYSDQDLDEMVENFNRLSTGSKPKLQPPAVLGHEEDQELLERSDLPAAGWPKKVWRDGHKLMADIGEVPPAVAKLINQRAYRKVSSEIYDDFEDQGTHYGKTLRRVAFLGGEIPQVKSLADIPQAEFSEATCPPRYARIVRIFREGRGRRDSRGTFQTFSAEVEPPMDRDTILSQLEAMDVDTGALADCSDEALGVIADLAGLGADENAEGRPDATEGTVDAGRQELKTEAQDPQMAEPCPKKMDDGTAPTSEDATPPMDYNDGPRPALSPPPGPSGTPRAKPGDAAAADVAQGTVRPSKPTVAQAAVGGVHAEPAPTPAPQSPKKVTMHYSERLKKMVDDTVTKALTPAIDQAIGKAVSQAVAAVKAEAGEVRKYTEEERANRKKLAVESFVESRMKPGNAKITPAEKDAVLARLNRADSKAVVTKFAENGKDVELTELDLQMREVDARPVHYFGERVKASQSTALDAEVAEVENHFEIYREEFKKVGISDKDQLVKGFKSEKARKPELTAKEFLHK